MARAIESFVISKAESKLGETGGAALKPWKDHNLVCGDVGEILL